MKKALLSLFFSASAIFVIAQPRCFVVGPAYNMGSTKITNYSFTRIYSTDADGTPATTFMNFKDAKNKASAAGLVMDIYSKHCRFGMDIMVPLKNSQANFFNINLAFGGYIKEKVGILVGLSGYANSKKYSAIPSDTGYVLLATNAEYNTSGKYYSNAAPGSMVGANLLLTYALTEKCVVRLDLGTYVPTTESKKTPYLDNYEYKKRGSKKVELGIVYQFTESFGAFAKVNMWNTKGTLMADLKDSYSSGITKLEVMPEQKFKSTNFTFGIMIPLGSAESRSGTISIAK